MIQFTYGIVIITYIAHNKQGADAGIGTSAPASHPGDLEELQSVLHFPEEVALRITDAEYHLFYRVKHFNFLNVLNYPLLHTPLVFHFKSYKYFHSYMKKPQSQMPRTICEVGNL